MIVCKNCGAENPAASLYCQDCGSRLGDWKPAEGSSRMATPPTGLARSGAALDVGGAASAPAKVRCPRCSSENAAHMRFCNNCGYPLRAEQAAGPAAAAAPEAKGTICWRCYGVGDPGAEFCKFCGARYADAPSAGAPSAAAAPAAAAPAAAPGPAPRSGLEPASLASPAPSPERAEPSRRGEPAARPAAESALRGTLVSILKDGTDGRRYPLQDDQIDIGRQEGHLVLADDPYLSPRHARLSFRTGQAVLRDLDSANGVYARLREPVDLADGDMVLLGQQVLRFEVLSDAELPLGPAMQHGILVFGTPEVQRVARLVQYTTEGVGRDVHYLYRDETVIGREQGDIVFTDDPFMSRRHAAISIDRASRRFVLRDLGSSNGTAVRFRGERELRPGDQFRVGRHLFRFDAGSGGGHNAR
jgi:pSer/pThr/pTyr-binding forkhead associated (FHA) protein